MSKYVKVGDTCRHNHGDKVTECTVVKVTSGSVVSVSRWISGTPYQWQGQTPHNFRWVCTHRQWEQHLQRADESAEKEEA
jgi:hypothetical protein